MLQYPGKRLVEVTQWFDGGNTMVGEGRTHLQGSVPPCKSGVFFEGLDCEKLKIYLFNPRATTIN